MTRAEIEALSGRELDAAVATAVCGKDVSGELRSWVIEGQPWTLEVVPAYSTTWEGMGLVLAWLLQHDYAVESLSHIEASSVHIYRLIGPMPSPTYRWLARALSEAVARAALLAVARG